VPAAGGTGRPEANGSLGGGAAGGVVGGGGVRPKGCIGETPAWQSITAAVVASHVIEGTHCSGVMLGSDAVFTPGGRRRRR
jgi:hypothetical protein